MAKIIWGVSGERYFETGLDKGVFFLGTAVGVPWNGLISVSEGTGGASARPFYLDGKKILNLSSVEEFEAKVSSFFSPVGFDVCDGSYAISPGLFATQQPRKSFSFTYRTLLGNDVDAEHHAYKIHLVYNALAIPSDRERRTINENAEAVPLSWDVSTLPPAVTGLKPTAHFVIDSRTADATVLSNLEDLLYGTDLQNSAMPTVAELITLFGG